MASKHLALSDSRSNGNSTLRMKHDTSTTTFRFPAFRNFRKRLGEMDAATECIEVGVRILQKKLQSETLSIISASNGIKVDDVSSEALRSRSSSFYILGVHNQFQLFLHEFRNEHPSSREWRYNDGKDLLTDIISNLHENESQGIRFLGKLEYDVCEHYRKIRDGFMHPSPRADNLAKSSSKLKTLITSETRYDRLNAPNIPSESNFDDFVLYSRSAKSIAERLCILGRPTNEEIASLLLHNCERDFLRWKSFAEKRRNNAILHALKNMYSLNDNEAQLVMPFLIGR